MTLLPIGSILEVTGKRAVVRSEERRVGKEC